MSRAAIIGSGPNGLSAAITMARAGVQTCVYEGRETIGGAASTAEVTLPGFRHDLGSSIYPMGVASPFFQSLPLQQFGLQWIEPPAPLAHPLDDGTAVILEHDLAATAAALGADSAAYARVMRPLVDGWSNLSHEILGPILHWPQHPFLLARFGAFAAPPATMLAKALFGGPRARALFAGMAAHSVLPLESVFSSAVGLVLAAAAHTTGWPIAAGGAQSLSDALAAYLRSLGGRIETGRSVQDLSELGACDAMLCDVSPRRLLRLGVRHFDPGYNLGLRSFQYGPGAFKVDWALSQSIPWKASDCLRAATVHLGGTLEEIAASERAPWHGRVTEKPFVLVTQPSLFDPPPRPRRKTYRLGLLPRPQWLPRLNARGHRIPGRALRPRLPRLRLSPPRRQHSILRSLEPQPRRRRPVRRRNDNSPTPLPAHQLTLSNTQERTLSMQRQHPTRRRSPRHVRLPRRPGRIARSRFEHQIGSGRGISVSGP